MRMVLILVLAALLLAGCGKVERTGTVGDTLEAHDVSARLITVKTRVAGDRRFGADVAVCNQAGDVEVVPADFRLELADGRRFRPQYPQRIFDAAEAFDGTRSGCERGWLVFKLPRGVSAKALGYRYENSLGAPHRRDDTVVNEQYRFTWTL